MLGHRKALDPDQAIIDKRQVRDVVIDPQLLRRRVGGARIKGPTTLPSSCLPLIGREVKTREVSSAAVMLFPWTTTRLAGFMILSLLPTTIP